MGKNIKPKGVALDNKQIQGLKQVQTKRTPDEDWMQNIYQLKRRLQLLINWCTKKYISRLEMMIVLDEVLNGSVEDVDGSKMSLKYRIEHKIK